MKFAFISLTFVAAVSRVDIDEAGTMVQGSESSLNAENAMLRSKITKLEREVELAALEVKNQELQKRLHAIETAAEESSSSLAELQTDATIKSSMKKEVCCTCTGDGGTIFWNAKDSCRANGFAKPPPAGVHCYASGSSKPQQAYSTGLACFDPPSS